MTQTGQVGNASPGDVDRMITRLPAAEFEGVADRIRRLTAAEGLDGVIVDHDEDIAYLTGFFHFPTERPVWVWVGLDGPVVLVVPSLEREYAAAQHAAAEIRYYDEYPSPRPNMAALPVRAGAKVGFASSMSVARSGALAAHFRDARFTPTDLVQRCRAVKTEREIALHREAARITDLMLLRGQAYVAALVEGGELLPAETELAAYVTQVGTSEMYTRHADVVSRSILAGGLIYSGPNSAFPHGFATTDRLKLGDTFILSLGCAVGGRYVEGERTFVLGEPTEEQSDYYEAVRAAQEVGAQAIRPGARAGDVSELCLSVLRDAGFGEYIRHRQGHGIGLGIHEPPWLADGDDTVLEPGMIFSNEPGLYIAGHAGYRISDSMLVTADGSERLTDYPRDLDSVTISHLGGQRP